VWMDFPTASNQTPNTVRLKHRSQTVGAKLHSQEEKSPDCRLRSLNLPASGGDQPLAESSVEKEVRFL